jgi:hypothetical protein
VSEEWKDLKIIVCTAPSFNLMPTQAIIMGLLLWSQSSKTPHAIRLMSTQSLDVTASGLSNGKTQNDFPSDLFF